MYTCTCIVLQVQKSSSQKQFVKCTYMCTWLAAKAPNPAIFNTPKLKAFSWCVHCS